MKIKINLSLKRDDLSRVCKKLLATLGGQKKEQVLRTMGQEFLAITQEQFGPDKPNRPAPWPPLSEKYKKRIGYSGPPKLVLSGDLQNSFDVTATPNEVIITAHSGHAATHQFGRGNIPARPFAPVVDGKLTSYAEERIRKKAEQKIIQLSEI
jgi:phage gpG-like protein